MMNFVNQSQRNVRLCKKRNTIRNEQWRLDEIILIQSIKSVTDYFLKEQYMWFYGENGFEKKEEAK